VQLPQPLDPRLLVSKQPVVDAARNAETALQDDVRLVFLNGDERILLWRGGGTYVEKRGPKRVFKAFYFLT
jgi:hypothetical protein